MSSTQQRHESQPQTRRPSQGQDDGRLPRLATGLPALDRMLDGGLPQYGVIILAGEPGTGKTVLCQQILFSNTDDQPSAYLTTLSESPMKVARYQSRFSFFDTAKFGTSVVYMDIGQIVREQGLRAALDVITDTLRDLQPRIVAIDSFKAIHDLAPSASEMRSFVYDISIELAAMQTTSLLVGEYSMSDIATYPEFAVADGIIWLYTQEDSSRTRRYLRIVKMRGVHHSDAAQNFDITGDGIEIYSTEGMLPTGTASYGKKLTKTGLPELDELLRGGIPQGSPLLLTGGAGTGKTTLGLQFLYEGAANYGEKGVYFSYEEPPEQLLAEARGFGWDFAPLIEAGKIKLLYTPLGQINPSQQLLAIQAAVQEIGAQRAVVDSLTMLMGSLSDPRNVRTMVQDLVNVLKEAGCTAIVISDPPVGAPAISRFGVEESIIDGVILLKLVSERRARARYLEVYKMRGVNHASGDNLMKITSRGIQVYPRMEEA